MAIFLNRCDGCKNSDEKCFRTKAEKSQAQCFHEFDFGKERSVFSGIFSLLSIIAFEIAKTIEYAHSTLFPVPHIIKLRFFDCRCF